MNWHTDPIYSQCIAHTANVVQPQAKQGNLEVAWFHETHPRLSTLTKHYCSQLN